RGRGVTVAIVDSWDDPKAESDLAVYRKQFGLPPCTTANGCFKKVNKDGKATPLPRTDPDWAVEISIDLDMLSAACALCHILLVGAANERRGTGVKTAAKMADVIRLRWAAPENEIPWNESVSHHPGIPIAVLTGDEGYNSPNNPAMSFWVTSVGG